MDMFLRRSAHSEGKLTTPAPNLAASDDAHEEQAVGLRTQASPGMIEDTLPDHRTSSSGQAAPSQQVEVDLKQIQTSSFLTPPGISQRKKSLTITNYRDSLSPPPSRSGRWGLRSKPTPVLNITSSKAAAIATMAATTTPPGSRFPIRAEIFTSKAIGRELGRGYPENSDFIEVINEDPSETEFSIGTRLDNEDHHLSPLQIHRVDVCSVRSLPSRCDESNNPNSKLLGASGKNLYMEHTNAELSPSQRSPQSDSKDPSEVSLRLLTKVERKIFLIGQLTDYFSYLFSPCHSPVLASRVMTGSSEAGRSGIGENLKRSGTGSSGASGSSDATNRGLEASKKRNPETRADDGGDDGDRDGNRPMRRALIERGDRTAGRMLACPYFKKDPEHSRLARSCSGPGWYTVHRIKQHLDRVHALPPRCERCYTAFNTDDDRAVHLRLQTQCELKEPPDRMHGFSSSQREQLKSRPRGYKQMSEIQKWRDVYIILFPETDKADIPSPYYNYASFHDPGHPVDHSKSCSDVENDDNIDGIHDHVGHGANAQLPSCEGVTLRDESRVPGFYLSELSPEHSDRTDEKTTNAHASFKPEFEQGHTHSASVQENHVATLFDRASSSYSIESNDDGEKDKNVGRAAAELSPSQRYPQSDSESSSESSFGLLTKDERKMFLLHRLMSYFDKLFASSRATISINEAAMSSGETDSTGAGKDVGNSGRNSGSGEARKNAEDRGTGSFRKRCHAEDDENEDENDRDQGQPGKRTRVDGDKRIARERLACPYFKTDPYYHRLAGSCSGPGWDTVHRIKEHLDRNHGLPPSCDRCYQAFKTDADRTAHLRSETQCPLRQRPSRMQGFDACQKDQLKGRPKGYKQKSEIEKWRHTYLILFPETKEADIPSAFYDYNTSKDPGHPIDLMVKYEEFLCREMPERVKHQLELRIKRALDPIEQELQSQIVDIACDIQVDLFKSFRLSIDTETKNSESFQRPDIITEGIAPESILLPTSKPYSPGMPAPGITAPPIGDLSVLDIDGSSFCYAFPSDFDGVRFDMEPFKDEPPGQDFISGMSSDYLAEPHKDHSNDGQELFHP